MSLLVVGSIAIDDVETPEGRVGEVLGGSASFFAIAAGHFHPVRLVGVIGEDYPPEFLDILERRPNLDLAGVERQKGKSFRWRGRYEGDMSVAQTLEVHLNVFGSFEPKIPGKFRDSEFVFLANASPLTQRKTLEQMTKPKLVVADTMNLWIETARDELLDLMKQVDGLVMNDQEALMLTDERKLVNAGFKVLDLGPRFVVIKKGEHGATLFAKDLAQPLPAFPTRRLVDPTGAGDTFAGGMMGYLASVGRTDADAFKRALAYGTILASFNVEDFSSRRLVGITREDVEQRLEQYRDLLRID